VNPYTTLEKIVPPQDIEAEQSVLGSVLIGKASPDVIQSSEFYYRDAHKEIARAIVEIRDSDSNKEVDLITVTGHLKDKNKLDQVGGPAYLASLTDDAPIFFSPGHVEIIREKSFLRAAISSGTEVVMAAYQEQDNPEGILAKWERKLIEVMERFSMNNREKLEVDFNDLMNSFLSREVNLNCINDAIGGLPTNGVTIIGGQTSMGKTSLALGFMKKIAIDDRLPVAYFGRITQDQIYFRLMTAMCKIGFKSLKRGNINGEERKALREVHDVIEKAPIYFYPLGKKTSTMDIISQARALSGEKRGKIGAIIVENLQELVWPERTKSRKEEIDIIVKSLNHLTMSLHAPVVLSSQVNRDVSDREDKRARPTDMLGSSDIESLARLILLPFWEEYYLKNGSASEDGSVDAEIAIYKTGSPTVLSLIFNPNFLLWEDV